MWSVVTLCVVWSVFTLCSYGLYLLSAVMVCIYSLQLWPVFTLCIVWYLLCILWSVFTLCIICTFGRNTTDDGDFVDSYFDNIYSLSVRENQYVWPVTPNLALWYQQLSVLTFSDGFPYSSPIRKTATLREGFPRNPDRYRPCILRSHSNIWRLSYRVLSSGSLKQEHAPGEFVVYQSTSWPGTSFVSVPCQHIKNLRWDHLALGWSGGYKKKKEKKNREEE